MSYTRLYRTIRGLTDVRLQPTKTRHMLTRTGPITSLTGKAMPQDVATPSTPVYPFADAENRAGSRFGDFELLARIGDGGMGAVYLAEQTAPVKLRAAVKVIKFGMDTREVIARFEMERQALSMMDHPNIARVLDAGSKLLGRPYFVLELVRGVRITEYCEAHRSSLRESVLLFLDVCIVLNEGML